MKGERKEGFRPTLGRTRSITSWIMSPQFTGRTSDIAQNRVLAMVRLIRLGLSGLKTGMRKVRLIRSLRFRQFPGWKPSFGLGSARNFPANRPSRRPAHPSLTHLGNPYTLFLTSGVQLFGSLLLVPSHLFPLSNLNSRRVFSAWRFQGLASKPSQPITRRSSAGACNSLFFFGIASMTALSGTRMGSLQSSTRASDIFFLLTTSNTTTEYHALPVFSLLLIATESRQANCR